MDVKDDNVDTSNQDEMTMEQKRQIEEQIAASQPLVGEKESLTALENEYTDEVYRSKVKDLKKTYNGIRRMRGDGNCFFRAFLFAYYEHLLNDPEEFKRFKDYATGTFDELKALGFPEFTTEDFYNNFLIILDKVGEGCTLEELLEVCNDDGTSNYQVVYLRLITSGQLQKQQDFFVHFIDQGRTVKEFCSQEVEPMYCESDHIHITALTLATGVCIRVEYIDRSDAVVGSGTQHDFPDGQTPKITLLYRPGHYDVLYKN